MKALLDTTALTAALTAFDESLASGGERRPSADIYRQAEKRVYFAVDLAALTELGARAPEQDFSQRFAVAVADVLQNPDAAIEAGEILKHDRTTTVAKIQVMGISLVIKRYNRKSLLHGFTRLWRTTSARRSFAAARWLLQHGILTALPLVFIESRSFGALNHGAYYLSLCHPGDNLLRQLNSGAIKEHDFDAILSEFGQLFSLLRLANAAHGDMKISNFIFHSNRLCVLDLDATQPYKRAWQARRAFRKDLARFERNWVGSDFGGVVAEFLGKLRNNEKILIL